MGIRGTDFIIEVDDGAAFEDFDFENLPPEEDDETTSAESDAHTQDDTEDDRPRSGTVVWIVVAVGMILAAGLLFVTSRKKQYSSIKRNNYSTS